MRHSDNGLRAARALILVGVLAAAFANESARAAPGVLVRGVDSAGTGANLAETTLKTSNVGPGTFGRLFSLPVDGHMYAQPLYVPNVPIPGQGTHNVVYAATMNNMVYAYDADSPGPALWMFNATSAIPGATLVPAADITGTGADQNLHGNLGIQSTPVIDAGSQTLYLVARTLENGQQVFRLHALDITSGAEKFGGSVVINASYTVGGTTLTLDPTVQLQRQSLTLAGGKIIIGFGSYGDNFDYHGWLLAYDERTLAQTGVFVSVPTAGRGGAFWQSGRAPVVDSSGFVYAFVGNAFGTSGFDGIHNFSESCLKLDPSQGLALVDYFTPSNWAYLDAHDDDLGASGPLLIPGTSLLFGGGKYSTGFLLNTGGLGHLNGAAQQITWATGESHGGPVVWPRSSGRGGTLLYNWAQGDRLKAWGFNGSTITGLANQSQVTSPGLPGGILALSANGDLAGTGIIWALLVTVSGDFDNGQPPVWLRAFDAENLGTELWNSRMNLARDDAGLIAKFAPPIVVNGKVYVATGASQIVVYGLLPQAPGFTMAAQPAKVNALGGTAKVYLTATTAAGAAVTPTWSVTGLPTNAVATFAIDSLGRTVMQVNNLGGLPDGPYYLTVTATAGTFTASQTVLLQAVSSVPAQQANAVATSVYNSEIAHYAIDQNPATFWHSAFGPLSNSLTVDLGSVEKVNALSYLPRQDGCSNGTYSRYQIWLSTDNVNWTQMINDTFDYVQQPLACDGKSFARPQTVTFAASPARYVLFEEFTDVAATFSATVAEIQVFNSPGNSGTPPTLTALSLSGSDAESGSAVVGTCELSSPAPVGGVTVALASSDSTRLTVPASVVVAAGATQANFTAATVAGSVGTVTITATLDNASQSASLNLHAPIPQTGWQLKFVTSQQLQNPADPAINAFDGNSATIWYTKWGTSTMPNEIQIDLGVTQTLNGFVYLPRQDGCANGTIAQYQFYVSSDGVNWGSPVSAGNFNYGTTNFPCGGGAILPAQRAYFAPTSARFVRLRALSEVNGHLYTTAAEINVLH